MTVRVLQPEETRNRGIIDHGSVRLLHRIGSDTKSVREFDSGRIRNHRVITIVSFPTRHRGHAITKAALIQSIGIL